MVSFPVLQENADRSFWNEESDPRVTDGDGSFRHQVTSGNRPHCHTWGLIPFLQGYEFDKCDRWGRFLPSPSDFRQPAPLSPWDLTPALQKRDTLRTVPDVPAAKPALRNRPCVRSIAKRCAHKWTVLVCWLRNNTKTVPVVLRGRGFASLAPVVPYFLFLISDFTASSAAGLPN